MNKMVLVIVGIVGILLIVIAGVYFIEPAKSLPHFFPGYTPGLGTHHYKHGIAALITGLAVFAFIWFESGKSSKKTAESSKQEIN